MVTTHEEVLGMYCQHCGEQVDSDAVICPKCGKIINREKLSEEVFKNEPYYGHKYRNKSKITAGVLALFFGSLGIHRFYLGQWWGIFYILFCWTFIPAIVSAIEGIVFLCSSDESFDRKYNYRYYR